MTVKELKIKVTESISVLASLSDEPSLDEILGFAEVVKKIKKVTNNISSTTKQVKREGGKNHMWSEEEEKQLIAMINSDDSPNKICSHFNISKSKYSQKKYALRVAGKLR